MPGCRHVLLCAKREEPVIWVRPDDSTQKMKKSVSSQEWSYGMRRLRINSKRILLCVFKLSITKMTFPHRGSLHQASAWLVSPNLLLYCAVGLLCIYFYKRLRLNHTFASTMKFTLEINPIFLPTGNFPDLILIHQMFQTKRQFPGFFLKFGYTYPKNKPNQESQFIADRAEKTRNS